MDVQQAPHEPPEPSQEPQDALEGSEPGHDTPEDVKTPPAADQQEPEVSSGPSFEVMSTQWTEKQVSCPNCVKVFTVDPTQNHNCQGPLITCPFCGTTGKSNED